MSDLKPVKLSSVQAATNAVQSRIDDVVAAKTAGRSKEPGKITGQNLFAYNLTRSVPEAERTAVEDSWAASNGPSRPNTTAAEIKQKTELAAKLLAQAAAKYGSPDEVSPEELRALIEEYPASQRGVTTDLWNLIPRFREQHDMQMTMDIEQIQSLFRLAMTYGDGQ